MKISLGMLALSLMMAAPASAQEPAEAVQTNGSGELRRASEAMVAPTSQNIQVRLPEMVRKGEIVAIQYEGAGTVSDSFMVTGITIRGDRCTLENKRNTLRGSALSDLIYVQACKKLR